MSYVYFSHLYDQCCMFFCFASQRFAKFLILYFKLCLLFGHQFKFRDFFKEFYFVLRRVSWWSSRVSALCCNVLFSFSRSWTFRTSNVLFLIFTGVLCSWPELYSPLDLYPTKPFMFGVLQFTTFPPVCWLCTLVWPWTFSSWRFDCIWNRADFSSDLKDWY